MSKQQWTTATASKFAKFLKEGDSYKGRLVEFDYEKGATMYTTREPCGYLDLRDEHGQITRISLDKNAILDPFKSTVAGDW